jgi:hypothetical protein
MVQNPKDKLPFEFLSGTLLHGIKVFFFSWDTMGLVLFKARVVMALARWSSKNSLHMSREVYMGF